MQHDVLDKVQTTVQPLMTNNHENFEKLLETVSDFQSTFEEQSTDDRQKLDDIRTAVLTRGRQYIVRKYWLSNKMGLTILVRPGM